MAAWTNARGTTASAREEIEELLRACHPHLARRRQPDIATALDLAAFFDVPTGSAFASRDRPLAIVHRAAHRLESPSATGLDAKGGGNLQAASNEQGTRTYAVPAVGDLLSPADQSLSGTAGGRAYLAMRAANISLLPFVG